MANLQVKVLAHKHHDIIIYKEVKLHIFLTSQSVWHASEWPCSCRV